MMEQFTCKQCKNENSCLYDDKQGNIVCTACGEVNEERFIDDRPEWSNYEGEEDQSRTEVADKYVGFKGGYMRFDGGRTAKMMASIQHSLQTQEMKTTERKLKEGMDLIEDLCSRMELPRPVVEEARDLFFKFESRNKKKFKGAKSEEFGLAVIFLACTAKGAGRTMKELCATNAGADEKKIRGFCKRISGVVKESKSTSPADFVAKFAEDLSLPLPVENVSRLVAERGAKHLEGKRSTTVAAVAVYFASQLLSFSLDANAVAKVASIAETTLKSHLKVFRENKSTLVSAEELDEALKDLEEK